VKNAISQSHLVCRDAGRGLQRLIRLPGIRVQAVGWRSRSVCPSLSVIGRLAKELNIGDSAYGAVTAALCGNYLGTINLLTSLAVLRRFSMAPAPSRLRIWTCQPAMPFIGIVYHGSDAAVAGAPAVPTVATSPATRFTQ
jgi:hypothetical protein